MTNPPDYDDPVQHPPIIQSRTPENPFVDVDLSAVPPLPTFEATVRDNDLDDDIRYRWYFDYTNQAPLDCPLITETSAQQTADPAVRVVARPPTGFWSDRLVAGRCHRLTLVVTDGAFEPDGCTVVTEGSRRATFDWWLLAFDESAGVSREEVRAADCATLAAPLGT